MRRLPAYLIDKGNFDHLNLTAIADDLDLAGMGVLASACQKPQSAIKHEKEAAAAALFPFHDQACHCRP